MSPAVPPAVPYVLKHPLGPRWTTRLGRLLRGQERPRWGNLRRVRPFSESFGFDRGTVACRKPDAGRTS